MVLAGQGKLAEAVNEFAEGARLRPDDSNAEFNPGIALARLGRLDDAIAHFSEALAWEMRVVRMGHLYESARSIRLAFVKL